MVEYGRVLEWLQLKLFQEGWVSHVGFPSWWCTISTLEELWTCVSKIFLWDLVCDSVICWFTVICHTQSDALPARWNPTNWIHVVSNYQSQCHLEMEIHHSLDNHINETFPQLNIVFTKFHTIHDENETSKYRNWSYSLISYDPEGKCPLKWV